MEFEQQIHHLLKRNRLSVTESRSKILELFLSQTAALAHSDIEKRTGLNFDRVTIYRTLQTFLERGILHTVPTSDNAVLYALCKNDCSEGHHHDHHIHFICQTCGNTQCLEEVEVPEIMLPRGYTTTQVQVVVNGICKDCKM